MTTNPRQDLNDMMVFLAVVESGGFTAAAEQLNIPKANISRKVSKLEASLGVTLLERSTRSQKLTEAGKRYIEHCKRIQEELDLASGAVSEILEAYKGEIRVGTSVSIGNEIIRPELAAFLKHYPEITIDLRLVNQRVELIEGGYDMLIRVGKLEDSRLVAKHLGTAERYIYASPNYLAQRGTPSLLSDLNEHDLLLMPRLAHFNKMSFQSCRHSNKVEELIVSPKLSVEEFSILKQVAIEAEGVAILPSYMCHDEVASGQLVRILVDWKMPAVDIYALYPRHRVKIPKVKAFLEHISQTFAKRLSD